jgi:hypothetical protein
MDKSIEELERELNALSPKQAQETLDEAQSSDTSDIDPELAERLDFDKHPITVSERSGFLSSATEAEIKQSIKNTRSILYWLKQ